MKAQLRGVLATNDGQVRTWTGVPIGFLIPKLLAKPMADLFVEPLQTDIKAGQLPTWFPAMFKLSSILLWLTPLVPAIPMLAFKQTRNMGVGVIIGGACYVFYSKVLYGIFNPSTGTGTDAGTGDQTEAGPQSGAAVRIVR